MADFLTHLFLPLTVAYVLFPDTFPSPEHLVLGGFGLLADFDKFLGYPGLLHSLLTLVPLVVALLVTERWWRGRFVISPIVGGLILSHLVLDIVDGGPVPLLYPLTDSGIGLRYPATVAFGVDPYGIAINGPLVTVVMLAPRSGFNEYGFIDGIGVANAILFVSVAVGLHWQSRN